MQSYYNITNDNCKKQDKMNNGMFINRQKKTGI
jgi:hypothetical protein